jgi:HAD superfamily hydrolase (TIGR01490 family)
MNLALFDLDHTLIPFDSGMAWTRRLIAHGHLPAEAEERYLGYARQYVAGTLDIRAMHRAVMAPWLGQPRSTLDAWVTEFRQDMAQRVPASTLALVARHRSAGDLCAIVTATTRLIAAPFGGLFDIPTVIATEAATIDGTPGAAFTGEIDGEPCYREYKLQHVRRWLARLGLSLEGFARSWFYSDSASDLPLLDAVTDPVAAWPDDRLRELAMQRGWPILEPAR